MFELAEDMCESAALTLVSSTQQAAVCPCDWTLATRAAATAQLWEAYARGAACMRFGVLALAPLLSCSTALCTGIQTHTDYQQCIWSCDCTGAGLVLSA